MVERILVGDIGGTNCRFAIATRGSTVVHGTRSYENAGFASLGDAIETYLAETGAHADAGVVDIAGPVAGERVGPTNLQRWLFNPQELAARLSFHRLGVINDFEAVAHALPFLQPDESVTIGPLAMGELNGNLAVLGPGTGLGVGALVRGAGQWIAVPSEGGHAEVAPCPDHLDIHARIMSAVGRVSGEHVLSGPGLQRIHTALTGGDFSAPRPAAEIGRLALSGSDPLSRMAARLFFDYLARFAGDVALMFAAKGGVFLYGGVAQRLAPLLDAMAFRAAFEGKAPLNAFLSTIPTKLITAPCPGLVGCAAVAASW